MIDIKALRDNPEHFKTGAADKQMKVDFDRILALDAEHREMLNKQENLRSEQKKLAKETGPKIGQLSKQIRELSNQLSLVGEAERRLLKAQIQELEPQLQQITAKPAKLKAEIHVLDETITRIHPELQELLLELPQPADPDVPKGTSSDDNVEISTWAPSWWDQSKSFAHNKGFTPKSHIQLVHDLKLVDFERGVKIAGTRSYVMTGDGMRLHQAVLRMAFDYMSNENGFEPRSVPALVREEAMLGTGFFPHGKDQSYHIEESARGGGHDMYLTGTGEVGLMSLHQGEILDETDLPLRYITVSPCYRREAGAAGKDTAGLYRIHQFEKVEQVVICKADEQESRDWHKKMLGFVTALLERLELPYRLLQCCTGDLGQKNADMIDVECWMPGRGDVVGDGTTSGDWGETHSASRLYEFQCRRLNLRYRKGGEAGKGPTTFCHSLNNTVLASPRFLIPLMEMHQQADGSIKVPEALRPYMNGQEQISV